MLVVTENYTHKSREAPIVPLSFSGAEHTGVRVPLTFSDKSLSLPGRKKKKKSNQRHILSCTLLRPPRLPAPKLQGVTNILFRLSGFTINKGQFSSPFTLAPD